MLKRKIYEELQRWKKQRREEKLKKCLLVRGARQVGKSFIINEFGKEYRSFISIDFFRQPGLKAIFEGELTAEEIFKRMTAWRNTGTILRSMQRGRRSSSCACAMMPCQSSWRRN